MISNHAMWVTIKYKNYNVISCTIIALTSSIKSVWSYVCLSIRFVVYETEVLSLRKLLAEKLLTG